MVAVEGGGESASLAPPLLDRPLRFPPRPPPPGAPPPPGPPVPRIGRTKDLSVNRSPSYAKCELISDAVGPGIDRGLRGEAPRKPPCRGCFSRREALED